VVVRLDRTTSAGGDQVGAFDMGAFLAGLGDAVRPDGARPLVVHADELQPLPAAEVHNPSKLAVAGDLPTKTFELFRQEIPAGESSDMQRHHHETVHFVISGDGHSEIEGQSGDEVVHWSTGDFVYTPPWTWHRHYNDSFDNPVEFLTIENSRLLGLFGVGRRQSAGMVSMAEARAQFKEESQ
jgi:mannose-6-phosphate isomerase-like protein (cupin superfamily)